MTLHDRDTPIFECHKSHTINYYCFTQEQAQNSGFIGKIEAAVDEESATDAIIVSCFVAVQSIY